MVDKISGVGRIPVGPNDALQYVKPSASAEQARAFDAALDQSRVAMQGVASPKTARADLAAVDTGLGGKVMAGLNGLSERMRADQRHISSLIEKATVGGDMTMMIKASMAVGDYQNRVQLTARAVSKAATSLDQLTRLQ
jgi:hypothetical protein